MVQTKTCEIVYACQDCGEVYDNVVDAVSCCGEFVPNKVTSCCHAEIGERTEKEYPLGRAEGHYFTYPVPCCTECGKEVDE